MQLQFHGANGEGYDRLDLGVDGEPLHLAFFDGSFIEPALRVEANLIRIKQNELVRKECTYLCVCSATSGFAALALLKLYIQLTRLGRVEVAVNEQVLVIQAKELFLVRVDEPFARFVDVKKAGFLVISA